MKEKISKDHTVEVCVDSVVSAIEAEAGRADRLELCANLAVGGTTPSIDLFHSVVKYTNTPIYVLLRPRFGDFLYSQKEFEILTAEAKRFIDAGADGIVCGSLTPNGDLAVDQMAVLVKIAHDAGKKFTLHRAFDMCRDPFAALEQCKMLEVDHILTSGQENAAVEGVDLLGSLLSATHGEVEIIAGGGVTADNVFEIANKSGLNAFHMSGKKLLNSSMEYRNSKVNMGLPGMNEYEIWQTDREEISRTNAVLDSLEIL